MAEDLERIEAVLAHLTKALSDLKFNRPVTRRSSKCPFKGQPTIRSVLMCRVKRHLMNPQTRSHDLDRTVAGRSSTCPIEGQVEHWVLLMCRRLTPPISVTPSSTHPLLDGVDLDIVPQQKPVGSTRHFSIRGCPQTGLINPPVTGRSYKCPFKGHLGPLDL